MKTAQSLPGGLNADNVRAAKDIVIDKLGFGLDPNLVPDPITTAINESKAANIIKASEALAEMVRRTRDTVSAVGARLSGDDVMAAIAADMTDGFLDGKGARGADARVAAVATVVSSQVLVEALGNALEVGGVVATGMLDEAITTTQPGIGSSQLTDSVRISAGMLGQTKIALAAVQVLDSSSQVADIATSVSGIAPNSLPADIAGVLPADASTYLDNAVVLSPTATTEQIAGIGQAVHGTGGGITPAPGNNSAPVISGSPGTAVVAGTAYAFQPSASDADGDTLSFSISNKPAWASFSATTGRLSGTPGTGSVGSYGNIVIAVSDGTASASLPAFSIRVDAATPANSAPVISGTPGTAVVAGTAYAFQPSASDADGNTLSFSISNKPAWASFSATTGRLSGTPGTGSVGSYGNIVIAVSDGTASASLPAFSIRVDAATPANSAPVISGTPGTAVVAGTAYAFQPSASDADGNTLSFSISNKPAWASFSATTGRLSGTPGTGSVGSYGNIVIAVSDGTASASLPAFSIRVDAATPANSAPVISGTPGTAVVAGTAYAFQPSASDADGNTLSFSISNKPAWASFSATTGRLSGTPGTGSVGSYGNIVIAVSDGTASASLPAFSIRVDAATPANSAPVISGTPGTAVVAGTAYAFQPSASDADGNTLSFSISNKPAWASFSATTGRLSGTPGTGSVGSYGNIVIAVSDGTASASLPAFSIRVDAAPVQTSSLTLQWTAPVARSDGTPLTLADIDGFRIHYGNSAGSYTNHVTVADGTAQKVTLTDIPVGTYYLVMTTYDVDGRESSYSSVVTKTIQ